LSGCGLGLSVGDAIMQVETFFLNHLGKLFIFLSKQNKCALLFSLTTSQFGIDLIGGNDKL
jgi:hypothetical protein